MRTIPILPTLLRRAADRRGVGEIK